MTTITPAMLAVSGGAAAAPATPNADGPAATGAPVVSPQYVTVEQFNELKKSIADIPGMLHRRTKELEEKFSSFTPAQEDKKKPSVEQEVAEIQHRLDAERAEILADKRQNAIEAATNGIGLNDGDAKVLRAYLLHNYGEQIKADKTGVFVEGELGARVKLTDWMQETLKKDGLIDRFKPAVPVPTGGALWATPSGNGTGSKRQVSSADLRSGNFKREDLK